MAPSKAVVDERAADTDTHEIIQETPKRRWVSYIWDTFDKSPEERRLLTKLDAAILTFASLGSFMYPPCQWTTAKNIRLLYQEPRPNQHQQCLRFWNVRAPVPAKYRKRLLTPAGKKI
jgi:hypothetical protein